MAKTRLTFKEGSSDKFWEIQVDGNTHTVTFGRSGTDGQSKTKRFGSPADATKDAEKLIAEKRKKGYQPASSATKPAATKPRAARIVTKVGKVPVPPLLQEFQTFFAAQPADSLAIEGLTFEAVPASYDRKIAAKLEKVGFVFFELGEGSMIVVLQVDGRTPVALLDSEGGERLLASSIEELLVAWSKGKTTIHELDGGDFPGITPAGRKALSAWLEEQKVTVPKGPDFDLDLYLEDKAPAVVAPPATAGKPVKDLPPKLAAIVDLVGRRVDDPVIVKVVTMDWKRKLRASTTETDTSDWIAAPKKQGVRGIGISHEVWHDLYPPIAKTARAFIPYVTEIPLADDWPDKDLPFGLTWKSDEAALTRALGAPRRVRTCLGDDESETHWKRALDPARGIELTATIRAKGLQLDVVIGESHDLVSPDLVPGHRDELGVFLAWAIARGLLDEKRFAPHASLIAAISKRKTAGTALVDAALARGLWWDHFRDLPGGAFGLRDRLWHYFADDPTLTGDLCKLFGKRKNEHGHSVPTVPSDSWAAVDRASKVLDERFAAWVR